MAAVGAVVAAHTAAEVVEAAVVDTAKLCSDESVDLRRGCVRALCRCEAFPKSS